MVFKPPVVQDALQSLQTRGPIATMHATNWRGAGRAKMTKIALGAMKMAPIAPHGPHSLITSIMRPITMHTMI